MLPEPDSGLPCHSTACFWPSRMFKCWYDKTHKDFLDVCRFWCSVEPEVNIYNKLSRVLHVHPRTWPLMSWYSKNPAQKLLSDAESLSAPQLYWRSRCSSAKPWCKCMWILRNVVYTWTSYPKAWLYISSLYKVATENPKTLVTTIRGKILAGELTVFFLILLTLLTHGLCRLLPWMLERALIKGDQCARGFFSLFL